MSGAVQRASLAAWCDESHVAPEPEALPAGLPVRLVFGDALGRKDKDGAAYIAYFFEPAG